MELWERAACGWATRHTSVCNFVKVFADRRSYWRYCPECHSEQLKLRCIQINLILTSRSKTHGKVMHVPRKLSYVTSPLPPRKVHIEILLNSFKFIIMRTSFYMHWPFELCKSDLDTACADTNLVETPTKRII
jgi:hypothetical protein